MTDSIFTMIFLLVESHILNPKSCSKVVAKYVVCINILLMFRVVNGKVTMKV